MLRIRFTKESIYCLNVSIHATWAPSNHWTEIAGVKSLTVSGREHIPYVQASVSNYKTRTVVTLPMTGNPVIQVFIPKYFIWLTLFQAQAATQHVVLYNVLRDYWYLNKMS